MLAWGGVQAGIVAPRSDSQPISDAKLMSKFRLLRPSVGKCISIFPEASNRTEPQLPTEVAGSFTFLIYWLP